MIMSAANGGDGSWRGYYQYRPSSLPETTVLSTPAPAPAAPPPGIGSSGGSGGGGGGAGGTTQPSIEGRIGKTGRKRSRASRKAPTTLLNTDTTNFRAMVQQFTGARTAGNQVEFLETTAAGVSSVGPTTLSFGHGGGPRIYSQQPPPFSYLAQQHQYQQFNQNQESQFFLGGGRTGPIGNGDVFLNPQEGYVLEGEGSSSGMTRDVFPSR